MRHPVPDADTIRLIAALVYSHGGQITLTERQIREAPASYSVWDDPTTGQLVFTTPAQGIDNDTEE